MSIIYKGKRNAFERCAQHVGWLCDAKDYALASTQPKASTCMFSLIESAKANNVEPYTYMRWVIGNITAADTEEALDALLPWIMPYGEVETPGTLICWRLPFSGRTPSHINSGND